MLKEERLEKIVKQVERDSRATFEDLNKKLKVSVDTIRRDIKELADKGLLKAIRGGAMQNLPLPYIERESVDTDDKKIIAEKVVQFIRPDQVIFIDAGTTTAAAAALLPVNMPLTVITTSFPVVNALINHQHVEVIFAGGSLNKRTYATNGYETIQAIKNIQAHVCLLGVCSIDIKKGITGVDYQDTLIKKAMLENSRFKIALSTYEKVGALDPYFVCDANYIDVLITEKDPATSELDDFRAAGMTIL
jgi:DeoR/GlpR family transcriptional regulator of sugar metabolism